jgi:hypothetical protein
MRAGCNCRRRIKRFSVKQILWFAGTGQEQTARPELTEGWRVSSVRVGLDPDAGQGFVKGEVLAAAGGTAAGHEEERHGLIC